MTREEAFNELNDKIKSAEYVDSDYIDGVSVDAVKMAISALGVPETNVEDIICRQAAIDLMQMALEDDWEPDYATDRINELPPAQPTADVVECVQRNEEFDRVIEELLEIEAKNDIGFFTSYERSQFNAYVEDLLSMTIERTDECMDATPRTISGE